MVRASLGLAARQPKRHVLTRNGPSLARRTVSPCLMRVFNPLRGEHEGNMRVHSRIPSQRALVAAFGEDTGEALRRLLDGRTDPITVPATAAWVAQCYNAPRASELVENACNAVLGGFGCEAIEAKGAWSDFYYSFVAGYINLGDTYATTLLFDYYRGSVYICSWGDWVETSERTKRYQFN